MVCVTGQSVIVFTYVAFGGQAPFAFTVEVDHCDVVHELSIALHELSAFQTVTSSTTSAPIASAADL